MINGCANTSIKLNVDPFAGYSKTQSIINANGKIIKTNHIDFDNYACLSVDDFVKIKKKILSLKKK